MTEEINPDKKNAAVAALQGLLQEALSGVGATSVLSEDNERLSGIENAISELGVRLSELERDYPRRNSVEGAIFSRLKALEDRGSDDSAPALVRRLELLEDQVKQTQQKMLNQTELPELAAKILFARVGLLEEIISNTPSNEPLSDAEEIWQRLDAIDQFIVQFAGRDGGIGSVIEGFVNAFDDYNEEIKRGEQARRNARRAGEESAVE
jgi:hypothetical protein